MEELTLDTTEKILSAIAALIAIGGAAAAWLVRGGRKSISDTPPSNNTNTSTNTTNQSVVITLESNALKTEAAAPTKPDEANDVAELKRTKQLLFIDDDKGFKIVGILKRMGWENTKLVTDINSLEQPALLIADVVFVDIQGVGKAMHYSDEGLGLALAIKNRHPKKKVIIYSAEEKGARFHQALQEADYSLAKTAEPIRFEETIVRVLTK